jgi:hypothetical protein
MTADALCMTAGASIIFEQVTVVLRKNLYVGLVAGSSLLQLVLPSAEALCGDYARTKQQILFLYKFNFCRMIRGDIF